VPLLLLKLTLTPILICGASLAARRWGPTIGGWIVGLPLTSGPVLLFIALEHGPSFAATTSVGTLLGIDAIAAFCVGFTVGSTRGPVIALGTATLAYIAAGLVGQAFAGWPFPVLIVVAVVAVFLALLSLPMTSGRRSTTAHPRWDLPARVVVGTGLVLSLTTLAPLLGPTASGIATTFPVYLSVLSVFALLHDGRPAALGVLRGLLVGLFGTIGFFIAVHMLVETAGIGVAFAVAAATALAVSALALRVAGTGRGASAGAVLEIEPA
jgi:hypothetical protein